MDQNKTINLAYKTIEGEPFFMMTNHDQMDPFFMSIVSDGNHWMFISSNGGLTAGRKDANNSLFPYYTDDKLTELQDTTGSKTLFWVNDGGNQKLWEPFSNRQLGAFACSRNLYKSTYGNKIIFEEVNEDLGLTFRYQWSCSNQFGFVRKSTLINDGKSSREILTLDGVQNIMPFGVNADLQGIRSNLVDAYKRSELDEASGIGIYALSAIIVDRAEPSEALKANVAWSTGLDTSTYLLSSLQLDAFRNGEKLSQESDIKAKKGAYFVSATIKVEEGESKEWFIVTNVNQGPSEVVSIASRVQSDSGLLQSVLADIDQGTKNLKTIVSAADGFQMTSDFQRNARHYSNTLFNIMRGGIFDNNYVIEKGDFVNYLKSANPQVAAKCQSQISDLSAIFSHQSLKLVAEASDDPDFSRLCIEYMPLKFSRRHGDPSRPWNKFSINTSSELDGSKILDYEGNWRDIFQNWEALAHAYPEYIDSMIFKFLNASTFDGYNPYRVTKGGFDWEVIEEHDPWSYIGYWGDHQIIYLQKFLEFIKNHFPERLTSYLNKDLFVYANVPYKIKSYEQTLENPKDTILFDYDLDLKIRKKRQTAGADGALLTGADGHVHHVNFIEKILATLLAKLSNFIPEGGIWLNTQRPEWNDANNALVGNGVSMVTLYYLRRFLKFHLDLLQENEAAYEVSSELHDFYTEIKTVFVKFSNVLSASISDTDGKNILDGLGQAGSNYRRQIYEKSFSGEKKALNTKDLTTFIDLTIKYLDHSIDANKRSDDMYHAYNLMTVDSDQEVSITYLSEMLEGQVAVLSSGYLRASDSLKVLNAMKQSKLFRKDQFSYLLYPNKELPGFMDRNIIPADRLGSSQLLTSLIADGNTRVVEQDTNGAYHFNGSFNNASSLTEALGQLEGKYSALVQKEQKKILGIFEVVFNHKAFTGRSGTFYGFEGLGSIYWHMVSKLLLAVEEVCIRAINEQEDPGVCGQLLEHYYEINEGIGVHKSPELYGAFPIDPYSHTPTGKGAQQPGMTGQVKEDILSRVGEIGVFVKKGQIVFQPSLLRANEFLAKSAMFEYVDLKQEIKSIELASGQLAFTYCQVPIIYTKSDHDKIELIRQDQTKESLEGLSLGQRASAALFGRTDEIQQIQVNINQNHLK
ncbi:MAG: hypothetical protein ACI8QD_002580 [Cyclobacteriaceae bacterium]|jgi:hypothetical protein